jgi:hypothetical protein
MTARRSIDALVEKRLVERLDSGNGRSHVSTYMVLSAWDEMNDLNDIDEDYQPEQNEMELKKEEAEDALGQMLCPSDTDRTVGELEASVDSATAASWIKSEIPQI